jgi:hypothetical protein
MGFKACYDQMDYDFEEYKVPNEDVGVSPQMTGELSCRPATISDSKFEVPSEVNFLGEDMPIPFQ